VWTDSTKAAASLPMSDAEAASEVFSYSLNRQSGEERSLWNCKVTPRPNRDECMAAG
jgi:hypothetical protein